MNFTRNELKMVVKLINKEADNISTKINDAENIVFDLTERGEDTAEIYQHIRQLENALSEYCQLADKFEDLIVGSYRQ